MYYKPLHPAITHLNQQELDQLMAGYQSGVKITTLFEEFRIKAHASQVCQILPAMLIGQTCRICGAEMISRVLSRNGNNVKECSVMCSACQHDDSPSCRCANCVSERRRQASELQMQRKARLHQAIVAAQSETHASIHELSLETAVAFLAFTRCCPPNSMGICDSLASTSREIPYSPSNEITALLLESLRHAGLIAVSERSLQGSVDLAGDKLIYEPQQVKWLMTVKNRLELVEAIEIAGLSGDWPEQWLEQVNPLWLKIALAESRQFYNHQADARGFNVRAETAVTEMLNNVLRDFSVAQLYCVVWKGAQYAADFMVREHVNKAHAANFMIGACQRNADQARANHWQVKAFRRNFELPRSMLSYVLFDVILKIGERGFSEPIGNISNPV